MEPLLFNEDNHLIGTLTGDGSHSTNQQPNTSSRRASPSPTAYPVQGYARTRILCSGYNVRLKTRKENKIRPLKTKGRSTKTPPTTSQRNLYPSGWDRDQHEPQKKFMYMDYIQNFKNINKRTGKSVQQTAVELRKQTWRIHAIRTTTSNHERITTDNSPQTVRCGDKKWAKNTQSRTKGSYIYDVESCHIRTLTIHLENGLNRLRDST